MDDKKTVLDLDDFFASERDATYGLSAALMGRIMADAAGNSPARVKDVAPQSASFLTRILESLGGWPSVAGLASASVVGVWIGYAQPGYISSFTDVLISSDADTYLADISPDTGLF